ncbi:MAG: ribose 5-phosphate isomerase A [Ferruginibacter sp.]|nr:ribose 5-phosphate isomerase A [Ferruginibacter sp.]
MDLKKEAAQKAVTFIKDSTIVGLGAGSTITHIVYFLADELKNDLKIKMVTASFNTQQLLLQKGFVVQPIAAITELDIYFDGCDQVDKNLNALKSGGGIHTREKLLASMAKQFILVGDEAKYVTQFDVSYPMVVELLPEARHYVTASIQQLFPDVKTALRMSDKKEGPAITDNGNYLMDLWFSVWPPLQPLNTLIKAITGVVETSLFYNLAHKAIIAGKDGVKIIEKMQV